MVGQSSVPSDTLAFPAQGGARPRSGLHSNVGVRVSTGPAVVAVVGTPASKSRHVYAERPAGVFVDYVRDGHCWDDFDEVWCDAAVKAGEAVALDDVVDHSEHRVRAF